MVPLGSLMIEIPIINLMGPSPESGDDWTGGSSSDDNNKFQNDNPLAILPADKDEVVSIERCWEIINSIANRTSLPPNFKDVPFHSAMGKMLVSTSGFISKISSVAVTTKIKKMCGIVTPNYTAATTHIVATHALTEKVILARKRKLPVMTLEWVDAVWKACQSDPYVHGSQPQFQSFTCPLFHNVKFYLSEGVSKIDKLVLKDLIVKNGGKLVGCINYYKPDIAICRSTREPCCKRARKLAIPTLTPAWVTVSLLDGVIHEYVNYRVNSVDYFESESNLTPIPQAGCSSAQPAASAAESSKSVPNINAAKNSQPPSELHVQESRSFGVIWPPLPRTPSKIPESPTSPTPFDSIYFIVPSVKDEELETSPPLDDHEKTINNS